MTAHTEHSHSQHHITPLKVYLGIGGILLVMTVVTVAVAAYDFGPANIIIALLIAGFKATLVAFFFMHLWYDSKLYFLIFASSLAFLAIFIGLTMYDTERRADIDPIEGGPIEPRAIIYQNQPVASDGAAMPHGEASAAPVDTLAPAGH